jgi:hypothetical protein
MSPVNTKGWRRALSGCRSDLNERTAGDPTLRPPPRRSSLDHLIGALEEGLRDGEAEGVGGLEVDN